jgi:hypothetical protein
MGMDELDGDHAPQVGVGGSINSGHASVSEQRIDLVSPPDGFINPILRQHAFSRDE